MADTSQRITNNLNAIAGVMREEGRDDFAKSLLEAQNYILELEEKLRLTKMSLSYFVKGD